MQTLTGRLLPLLSLLLIIVSMPSLAVMMSFERIPTSDRNEAPLGALENIQEDSLGFIWVASRERLARYDGTGLRYYVESPNDARGLCTRFSHKLLLDYRNQLWIATDNALCTYNPQKDYFEIYKLPLPASEKLPYANIFSLAEDQAHNLIIGARSGVVVLDPNRTKAQLYTIPNQQTARALVTDIQAIHVDKHNRIWLGTRDLGLMQFNMQDRSFHAVYPSNSNALTARANVQTIVDDIDGKLWIGYYQNGIERFNPETQEHEYFTKDTTLASTTVWKIIRDSENNIWFAADNGGFAQYNRVTNEFDRQYYEEGNPHSLNSDKIRTVFEDRKNNLWIGTYPEGFHFYHHKNNAIENYHRSLKFPNSQLNDNGVLCFFENEDATVLIGTEKGLNLFNPKTREMKNLSDPTQAVALPIKPITAITQDAYGNYWIGTWSDGIYRINFEKKEKTHFLNDGKPGSLNSNIIWKFLPDGKKGLWIGTQDGGLNYFNFATQEFTALTPNKDSQKSISGAHVYSLIKDNQQNYWIGGLNGLDYYNVSTGEFTHYSNSNSVDNDPTIHSQSIRAVHLDKKNRLWVATEDEGIYIRDPATEKFQHLTLKHGLPDLYITALNEDANGNIWAGTLLGLALIDGNNLRIKKFNQSQGILTNTINRGANLITRNGYFFTGGTEGFSVFKPENIRYEQIDFPVYLTRLKVSNQIITTLNKDNFLDTDITLAKKIHLQYHNRMFAFEFAGLNYHLASWNHYSYLLEGFDREWNNTGSSTNATFTNIPPGKYTFRVKSANSEGLWSNNIASIDIEVSPPFWLTKWAYLCYLLVLLGMGYFVYKYNLNKMQLEKDRELNNELLKLNEIKDAFLANTSHELRTPVNGMVGMAEALALESETATKSQREKINLIISSGKRLSSLINDILDYAKMADQDIVLYKSLLNIHQMVKEVFEITSILTKNKDIELVNETQPNAIFLFADPDRMQQIIINLVSNAIKYSDQGTVKIITQLIDNTFVLTVQDSGIGIAEEDLKKLFSPFSQLESSANRRAGGTGLGLTVTRHLIERHNGKIDVTSQIGVGSRFILSFPYGETLVEMEKPENKKILLAEQHEHSVVLKKTLIQEAQPIEDTFTAKRTSNASDVTASANLPRILLADDDPVNCMILQQLLKTGGYSVASAYDGAMAIESLNHEGTIEAAVLDINMPKFSGFQVAEKIRAHGKLKNIPILFLTATITDDDRKECAKIGNAKIELKPISKKTLYTTLDGLRNV